MPSSEEIDIQQELLNTYRRTLAHYLKQQAQFSSGYIPPHVSEGIREAREHIRRIKSTLLTWAVVPDDHPDDVELSSLPIPDNAVLKKAVATKESSEQRGTTVINQKAGKGSKQFGQVFGDISFTNERDD